MPTDPNDPLADQNIKDRFYGVNDPVANKLLDRASKLPSLEAPPDKAITTLYVGGLDGKVLEQDLRYGNCSPFLYSLCLHCSCMSHFNTFF